MGIRMGQTANCYCWKCLFVGRLTTLTEARKEKKGYSRLFQIVTRRKRCQTDVVSETSTRSWALRFFYRGEPRIFFRGGELVSCSTSTPINHIVFFSLQNTSCIRKPQVISRGGGHPLHPPPRSAPILVTRRHK